MLFEGKKTVNNGSQTEVAGFPRQLNTYFTYFSIKVKLI